MVTVLDGGLNWPLVDAIGVEWKDVVAEANFKSSDVFNSCSLSDADNVNFRKRSALDPLISDCADQFCTTFDFLFFRFAHQIMLR